MSFLIRFVAIAVLYQLTYTSGANQIVAEVQLSTGTNFSNFLESQQEQQDFNNSLNALVEIQTNASLFVVKNYNNYDTTEFQDDSLNTIADYTNVESDNASDNDQLINADIEISYKFTESTENAYNNNNNNSLEASSTEITNYTRNVSEESSYHTTTIEANNTLNESIDKNLTINENFNFSISYSNISQGFLVNESDKDSTNKSEEIIFQFQNASANFVNNSSEANATQFSVALVTTTTSEIFTKINEYDNLVQNSSSRHLNSTLPTQLITSSTKEQDLAQIELNNSTIETPLKISFSSKTTANKTSSTTKAKNSNPTKFTKGPSNLRLNSTSTKKTTTHKGPQNVLLRLPASTKATINATFSFERDTTDAYKSTKQNSPLSLTTKKTTSADSNNKNFNTMNTTTHVYEKVTNASDNASPRIDNENKKYNSLLPLDDQTKEIILLATTISTVVLALIFIFFMIWFCVVKNKKDEPKLRVTSANSERGGRKRSLISSSSVASFYNKITNRLSHDKAKILSRSPQQQRPSKSLKRNTKASISEKSPAGDSFGNTMTTPVESEPRLNCSLARSDYRNLKSEEFLEDYDDSQMEDERYYVQSKAKNTLEKQKIPIDGRRSLSRGGIRIPITYEKSEPVNQVPATKSNRPKLTSMTMESTTRRSMLEKVNESYMDDYEHMMRENFSETVRQQGPKMSADRTKADTLNNRKLNQMKRLTQEEIEAEYAMFNDNQRKYYTIDERRRVQRSRDYGLMKQSTDKNLVEMNEMNSGRQSRGSTLASRNVQARDKQKKIRTLPVKYEQTWDI